MDLKSEILKEHSRRQCLRIVDFIGNNKERFADLIDVFLDGPYRITQRAAWPINYCVERNPSLIKPHLTTLLKFLKKPGIHDAVKRNTVRLLQFLDIPARQRARVIDICYGYLQNSNEPIAVRCFSMTVLANITRNEPDFKRELILTLEDQLPYYSAGMKVRALRVLHQLKK